MTRMTTLPQGITLGKDSKTVSFPLQLSFSPCMGCFSCWLPNMGKHSAIKTRKELFDLSMGSNSKLCHGSKEPFDLSLVN